MKIQTHKRYEKMWVKLSRKQQLQILMALKLLAGGRNLEKLRIHQLKGRYYPHYPLSAGGDLRVHYLQPSRDRVVLMMVGTHSQLYG